MSAFIQLSDYDSTIHRDILNSLLRGEADDNSRTLHDCEMQAIIQMKSYLDKTYDVEKIFSAEGEARHKLLLMYAKDITVYHLYCTHNPFKISKTCIDRYNAAIKFLQDVADGAITIFGAPRLPEDQEAANSRWQINNNEFRQTHF